MSHLSIEGVSLVYRRQSDDSEFLALDGIDLAVEPGEFVAIVGPSGCGKSSLLVLVNGLMRPTTGRIALNGVEANSQLINWLPPSWQAIALTLAPPLVVFLTGYRAPHAVRTDAAVDPAAGLGPESYSTEHTEIPPH